MAECDANYLRLLKLIPELHDRDERTLTVRVADQDVTVCIRSWGTDGTIVFTPRRSGGLMRVSDAGGEPESLTLPDTVDGLGNESHRWPDLLPGNRVVIFTSTENNSDYSAAEIVALSLEDGSLKTIVKNGIFARFVKERHQ